MKLCKRITGFALALLLVVGMIPANVLADTVTYTGIDIRVYNTNVGDKIQDATPNIQYATDEMSEIHKPDNSVSVSGTWYHTIDALNDVPTEQQNAYTQYTYVPLKYKSSYTQSLLSNSINSSFLGNRVLTFCTYSPEYVASSIHVGFVF